MPPLRTETQILADRIEALEERLHRMTEDRVEFVLNDKIRALEKVIAELVEGLPPNGQGHWRQGTKNQRNIYTHQGDDTVGKPVGQMYSADLAAMVCDAMNQDASA